MRVSTSSAAEFVGAGLCGEDVEFAQCYRIEAGGQVFAVHFVERLENVHQDEPGFMCCSDFAGKHCARA